MNESQGTTEGPSAGVRGRADLHIHTLASDGVSSVEEILDHAVRRAALDVIAITDHERIDAAQAAQRIAEGRGLRLAVIVGEEMTTRNGHLIGLFLRERIKPWGSMRDSVARIHDQGGVAIVAHPLVPYPLCASERTIRRLLESDERFHPDAIEAFNPTTARMRWSRRVPDFVATTSSAAVAGSDAHQAQAVGQAVTSFPGRSPAELRAAIQARTTDWEGTAYTWPGQLRMFGRQLGKYGHAIRDDLAGTLRRDGSGRDLGYPGGRRRPARFAADAEDGVSATNGDGA